jgi:hypothetical protein
VFLPAAAMLKWHSCPGRSLGEGRYEASMFVDGRGTGDGEEARCPTLPFGWCGATERIGALQLK